MDESWISPEAAQRITAAFLVVTNLVPLAGALTLGWDVGTILYLYWMESLVVGGLNIVRIALAQGQPAARRTLYRSAAAPEPMARLDELERTWGRRSPLTRLFLRYLRERAAARVQNGPAAQSAGTAADSGLAALAPVASAIGKLFMVGFFVVHYGMFMAVHAAFLYAFFGPPRIPAFDAVLMLGLMLVSHMVSFVIYFLMRQEYRKAQVAEQMFRPYGRIVVMHITILAGGLLVQSLRAPVMALIVMVLVKTGIDLAAHVRSHARTTWLTPEAVA